MAKISVTDCPAGPALDTAVAQALGHTAVYRHDLKEWFIASDAKAFEDGMLNGMFFETTGGLGPVEKRFCLEMPKYSSRIAAAWELADEGDITLIRVRNKGWVALSGLDYLDESDLWEMNDGSISGYYERHLSSVVIAPAPLAITRAFLLAHGVTEVEVPDD